MPNITGSSSNVPLQKSLGGMSIVESKGQTQLTFVKAKDASAPNTKVLDLTGIKPEALQSKEAFQKALNTLEGNSGQDLIKVRLSAAGTDRGQDVFVSLSALEKIPSGEDGKNMRDKLVESLMKRVEAEAQNPHSYLKEVTMELPHFITQGGKNVQQNAGGFQVFYGAETQRTVTSKFSVDAKDLSSIASLNDPAVTSLIDQVTSKVGENGKLATTSPDGKLTPTKGFDLSPSGKGQEQLRKMLDGYLAGGGFNQDLFNQVDAKGTPTKAATEYQKQVQDGLKSLISTGAADVGIKNPDEFTKKFTKTLFSDSKISSEDVKTIQTAFAAMAKSNDAFQKILDMPNPETGEKPKNNGIDGIPATRFAVVTSTLFAALEKKVTESRGTPPPARVDNYQAMLEGELIGNASQDERKILGIDSYKGNLAKYN